MAKSALIWFDNNDSTGIEVWYIVKTDIPLPYSASLDTNEDGVTELIEAVTEMTRNYDSPLDWGWF